MKLIKTYNIQMRLVIKFESTRWYCCGSVLFIVCSFRFVFVFVFVLLCVFCVFFFFLGGVGFVGLGWVLCLFVVVLFLYVFVGFLWGLLLKKFIHERYSRSYLKTKIKIMDIV